MWRPSFQFGQCVESVLLYRSLTQDGNSGGYETEGPCQCQGTDIRAGPTELNQGTRRLALVKDISTPTPIYTLSTPVLVHSPLPNSIMPAHRHSPTSRLHATGAPYKGSIIVISSDEEEEPLSVPKRGLRKPRHSRAEGEILEILDETSVKVEEPELESLRRRCHELEQACSPIAV